MADIIDINDPWHGHTGLEVETYLKRQLASQLSALGGKFGAVRRIGTDLVFYDEDNGNVIGSVSLSGQAYNISVDCNLPQTFYILADETSKLMTITPTTEVSSFGSSTTEDYPESYTFVVAVNNGGGYVNRVSGNIGIHGSTTFDIRPYLATGDNYIRVSVTGQQSHQTRSMVFTGTLTTLTMSCQHAWQNVWNQGQDYKVTGIRFAGSLVKTLHVSVNNVECGSVVYQANQSYTTTSTFYTIPASAFPSETSGVCSVKLWMTANGVSTPVVSYNIMCAAEGDMTPLVAINDITPTAVNFTSARLFSYAVYNADRVSIDLSATLNAVIYNVASGVVVTGRESGVKYDFAYALEVDTGSNETKTGSFAISATAFMGATVGAVSTGSAIFDNTYSYIATPGALFYLNAATRDNGSANHEAIVNEAGASQLFAASYAAVWNGFSWFNDGWYADGGNRRALYIPAGSTCSVTDLKPLAALQSLEQGMTIELLLQNANPSDYASPVLSLASGGANPSGILIYPTKIVVWGDAERNEDFQTVNISENRITHIVITFVKSYEGLGGKNICSVYVNGISNVCFAFSGATSFGNGNLVLGQPDTDLYLYKMRVYGSALESSAVFNNFLNCVFDGVEFTRTELNAENNVLEGDAVDYEKVKAAGYNTMVITTPNNVAIPSFFNQQTIEDCTVRFEYAGAPTKNVTLAHVPMDGQGTTSMKYFRWNLRWKTADSTTWTYGDGTTETGKEGHFIKDDSHPRVDRITAKKNIASSPQGHKMGMTGLYNDLFHAISSVASGLPNQAYQVAVYQFPFVGFQYNSANGQYEFIGIYTVGPDKNSKVTFGFKSSYGSMLSIEGPNHAPRGTRFLCPWVDVTYDYQQETLCYGGEEGWDCDFVGGGLKSDKAADAAAILALYTSEWKPAYDCVYDNSPYLASAAEVIAALSNPSITTLADLLTAANADTVKGGRTNGMRVTNEFIAFYDTSYDLYFYRRATGKYEKLPSDYANKNALTGLTSYLSAIGASTTTPTTAQLIAARAARFKHDMGAYWDFNQTLFHYCFCILYGVTDNFAKNTYPQKYLGLSDTGAGNRWGWRQDDLDSVLMTDNNGTNTKKYSVEHLDTFDGVQIFQGGDSALWVLIHDYYEDETREMMTLLVNAATSLATSMGIQGSGSHESLFNLTNLYCWEHSAKYFPITLYEKERRWSYIEPWLLAGSARPGSSELYPATYNGVAPLTQAVGDQYQGERLWMERRIAYIFSKYRIGAFTGTNTGYNAIVFTLARAFTFTLTPAIDLYPVVSLVQNDAQAPRTAAGSPVQVAISSSGDSNNSIHGGDWLASLGDLSRMRLTNRGGATSIDFFIVAARLQTLKIGDANAANLVDGFNATAFGVTSPTLTTLDARNTETVRNNIDLLGCPRLRTCLFAGSGASGLLLPVGAKLTEVSFPDDASTVFMHSLPFLQPSGLTLPTLSKIVSLYINNCANLNPFALVATILAASGEQLAFITLIWAGVAAGDIDDILELAERSGEVVFDGSSVSTLGGKPHIEGTVQVSEMYSDDYDKLRIISEEDYQTTLKKALSNLFGTTFYVIYDPQSVYIRFVDAVVEAICANNWGSGGRINFSQAAAVTSLHLVFTNNTEITSFNELKFFTGVTTWNSTTTTENGVFYGCTNLREVSLPANYVNRAGAFANCSSLVRINIFRTYVQLTGAFNGCTNLTEVNFDTLEHYLSSDFQGRSDNYIYGPFDVSKNGHIFIGGENVTALEVPSTYTQINRGVFKYVKNILTVTLPNTISTISDGAFFASGVQSVNLPVGLENIGASAFEYSAVRSIVVPSSVITCGERAFYRCHSMVDFTWLANVTFQWRMLMYTGGTGAGTGTFHCTSDAVWGATTGSYSRFTKFLFDKNLTTNGSFCSSPSGQDGCLKQIRVKGNLINANTGDTSARLVVESAQASFSFLEVMGTISSNSNRNMILNNNQYLYRGMIFHLGYDAYANNAVPCPISILGPGATRSLRYYVGKGQSEEEDNNIKSVYLADSGWAAYAYKIATWYEYLHEQPPTGYKRLVRVASSTRNAYIDTGVSGDNDNLSFRLCGAYTSSLVNYESLMGNYVDDASNCWCVMRWNNGTAVRCCTNRRYSSPITRTESANITDMVMTLDVSLHSYTNNGSNTTSEQTAGNTNATNILLGKNGTRTEAGTKEFYGLKIWDNGVLIRNYVPCQRESDSAVGFWEAVNGVFKTSDGSDEFTAGLVADFVD